MKREKLFDTQKQLVEAMREIELEIEKEPEEYLRQRYQIILLLLQKVPYEKIAQIMDISPSTIPNYRKAYLQHGIDGLKRKKNLGRHNYLTPLQEVEVIELLQFTKPSQIGFSEADEWTASLLRKWLKENFEIEFSKTGVLKLIHRLNFYYDSNKKQYIYKSFIF